MCESRAQFRSTRLWTLNDWVDTAARHNGGDAITICHKAVFERSHSPECIKLHSAKKTAIKLKSILICGPCHARVITAKTFLQMCCTSCPECHAHGLSLLGNYYPASVDCIPAKQRQRENQENRWSFCGLRFFGRHARTTVNLLRVQFKRSWPCVVSDEFSRIHPSVESAFGIISINKKVVRISHLFDSSSQLHFI